MFGQAGWQGFIDSQEVLVVMRFSYFGASGWQGDASRQKEILLDPQRLAQRLALLQGLALPSLAAQQDRNFHLMILCSQDMPAAQLQALRDICAAGLEAGRCSILPRAPGRAQKHLTAFLRQRYGQGWAIQTVLDDDDGLASDLIASLRRELAQLPAPEDPAALRFVSFADGFGLDLTESGGGGGAGAGAGAGPRLYAHRYPWLNLGLTLVATTGGKNILSIAHQKTPRQHPARLVTGRPMFLRSLHGLNDSRIAVSDRWKELADWRGTADIARRFPWLVTFAAAR